MIIINYNTIRLLHHFRPFWSCLYGDVVMYKNRLSISMYIRSQNCIQVCRNRNRPMK